MKKYFMVLVSSFLSGICIALGATVFLMLNNGELLNKFLGALMFGIGLYTIIHFELWLYTGKVGYVFDNKIDYFLKVLVCFLGNFLGAFILSFLLSLTSIGDILKDRAYALANAKMESSWYSILILSMLCGIMIYLSVEGHKVAKYNFAKTIFAFLPIILFIICGFEHVIANVIYFTYAGCKNIDIISFKTVLYFLLMFIGNAVGSIFLHNSLKLITKLKSEEIEENK